MPCDPRELVRVGVVARAHGLRGEVAVRPDDPERSSLGSLREVVLRGGAGGPERRAIRSARPSGRGWLVVFEAVASRTEAEGLRGRELWAEREALSPTEEGEYFAIDLVGLKAETSQGARLGVVARVWEAGAAPILEIKGEREWQVPLAEPFVKRIDIDAGAIVVDPPREEEDGT